MIVYRIAKTKDRANDLTGMGAFKVGGRWNNIGAFALYASEHQAMAMLEMLVHVDESELPPDLYIMTIEIDDAAPLYKVPDSDLPPDWRQSENYTLKAMGDQLLKNKDFVGFKVRSAVMPGEYNVVLNPLATDFAKHVRIVHIEELNIDQRLQDLTKDK